MNAFANNPLEYIRIPKRFDSRIKEIFGDINIQNVKIDYY